MIRPLELSSTVFSLGDANLHTSSKVVTFICPYKVILQNVLWTYRKSGIGIIFSRYIFMILALVPEKQILGTRKEIVPHWGMTAPNFNNFNY